MHSSLSSPSPPFSPTSYLQWHRPSSLLGGTWRAFYWFWSGLSIFSFGHALFLCPETYFQRPEVAFDGHILVQGTNWDHKALWELGWDARRKATPGYSWIAMENRRMWLDEEGEWEGMRSCYPQILTCLINPLLFWIILLNALVFGGLISMTETSVELPNQCVKWLD
jgi:hypothetical protein